MVRPRLPGGAAARPSCTRRSVLVAVPVSGQALAGSTTSASQAVSGHENVLHHQVFELASLAGVV